MPTIHAPSFSLSLFRSVFPLPVRPRPPPPPSSRRGPPRDLVVSRGALRHRTRIESKTIEGVRETRERCDPRSVSFFRRYTNRKGTSFSLGISRFAPDKYGILEPGGRRREPERRRGGEGGRDEGVGGQGEGGRAEGPGPMIARRFISIRLSRAFYVQPRKY